MRPMTAFDWPTMHAMRACAHRVGRHKDLCRRQQNLRRADEPTVSEPGMLRAVSPECGVCGACLSERPSMRGRGV